jgi:tetratricopeptide (TPR) repeat protein
MPIVLPPDQPKNVTAAKHLFESGVKLKSSGKLDEAMEKFERASELAPHSVEFLTAREFTRQQLVMQAIQRGNTAVLAKQDVVAMAEFRRALEYDPTNEFAQERLRETMPVVKPESRNMRIVEGSTEVEIQPSAEHHDFHYRGDGKTMLTQVSQSYGITAIFDDSVQPHRVFYDIEDVNFATAMETATRVTKTFWVPLSAHQIFIAGDTAENRRTFERMSLRTFYLSDITTPQDLVELQNALRILLDIRFIAQDPTESTITIRAPAPILEAASQLIESINVARPEVLLEMNVYQVSESLLRQLGNNVTTQYSLYNISPALLASLTGGTSQNLINQLIASGGINQANSTAIAALLAQLQQSSQNSIFSTPLATFGGGITFFGVTLPSPNINLSINESDIRVLQHATLRATQNNAAVMKIGERYPIVNATFAPVFNNAAISRVLGNQSYRAPFPSFNFEDLGLNLKATPLIHADRDVTLKIELQIRSLGTQTVNGQPIINNREYNGTITLKNGEAGVVAGLIGKSDSRSIMGYPFLSQVPGLTYAASIHDKNVSDDELLIVITPQVIRTPSRDTFAIQLPTGH